MDRRRQLSALLARRGAFRRFRILGTRSHSLESSTTLGSSSTNSVTNVGQLCNFSSICKDRLAERIMISNIAISYKNQLLRHTAMEIGVNTKQCIHESASDSSYSRNAKKNCSFQLEGMSNMSSRFTNQWNESHLLSEFGKKRKSASVKKPYFGQSFSTVAGAGAYCNHSGLCKNSPGFDICLTEHDRLARTNSGSIYEWTTENEMGIMKLLRPGMVLMKSFLTYQQQVDIVRTCQKLGVGPGGFYQPRYRDGAKLDLHMMCLGLNWNPENLTYEYIRSVDGCKAPAIPDDFGFTVHNATITAGAFLMDESDYLIPIVNIPNVCIVTFYPAATGALDLHQDRSERSRILRRRLPIVSFSVGDSAEFLYGDERDESTAEKVILDSGDVLMFCGQSRLIYHGISSIIPNSAPKELMEDTGLRPGRLSLSFREA